MTLDDILSRKPFIIAEVGSNWATLDHCLTSIHLAKACGADAVKFQAYEHHALYGSGDGHSSPATPMEGVLNLDWLPRLKEKAWSCGIEFMCSAFSVPLLNEVDKYVNIHKLASAEMTHVRMLERLREIGKPVIMSTGAQSRPDIAQALFVLKPTPVVLMYCPAAYPARWTDLDIIDKMQQSFRTPVGFSDHSLDVFNAPTTAFYINGVVVIEKHVNFVGACGPDAGHSLDVEEFKAMVQVLRNPGLPVIGPTPEETPFILRHKRRIIAVKDISVGETLEEGVNFGIHRSLVDDTRAASPWLIDQIGGKSAKVAIKQGQGIWIEDVE